MLRPLHCSTAGSVKVVSLVTLRCSEVFFDFVRLFRGLSGFTRASQMRPMECSMGSHDFAQRLHSSQFTSFQILAMRGRGHQKMRIGGWGIS